MTARQRRSLRASARAALERAFHTFEDLAVELVGRLRGRTDQGPPPPPTEEPAHADERTARRMAEAEHGGVSSAESDARWASGENPGGTHHKAVRREGPERPRPDQEEPADPKERVPGGERHMPTNRRG